MAKKLSDARPTARERSLRLEITKLRAECTRLRRTVRELTAARAKTAKSAGRGPTNEEIVSVHGFWGIRPT